MPNLSSLLFRFGRLLYRTDASAHQHFEEQTSNGIHICLMQALASEKCASGSCISTGPCNFATASFLQCLHAAHATK